MDSGAGIIYSIGAVGGTPMIGIRGSSFIDEHGRTLMLRGANVSGSSKVPVQPAGATHLPGSLGDGRNVSFVGRPFPLDGADGHFARLRHWGMTFLRLVITWEAVEHSGPGLYDDAYLDYLHALCERAAAFDISLFVDPHQDVWSRWTGGDGAPAWTLAAVGLDADSLDETGAAFTHQGRGDPFPRMTWPTNSGKLGAATMFTLFFAGSAFAPRTLVEGEPVQEWLQRRYIDAMVRVARRLSDLPNVVGYGTMNEPLPGYVGWKDLRKPGGIVSIGECPTGIQGMLLGAGIPQDVEYWQLRKFRISYVGKKLVNPQGRSAWLSGRECIWKSNGVWDKDPLGKPRLLSPLYFTAVNGRAADFTNDFYMPFAARFVKAIQAAHPGCQVYLESLPFHQPPRWTAADGGNVVFAPHWYDDIVLAQKELHPLLGLESITHRPLLGRRAVRRGYARQLNSFRQGAVELMGGAPTLLGEFGIPFDLNRGRAFRSGRWGAQERALDRSFRAVEDARLSCTIWNYAADNTNARGDGWNGEDFSIYSADQRSDPADPDSGARGLAAFARPYPRATAGNVTSMTFDYRRSLFTLELRHDPAAAAPTEIFLPSCHYGGGCTVTVSDGTWELLPGGQTLLYRHGTTRSDHWVRVAPAAAPR
jgi:hypothetical protein